MIKILNSTPFCLFDNKELSIASGYFAGDAFARTNDDSYRTKVGGSSFGWYDSSGVYYKNDKYSFKRPTTTQIITMMTDALRELAIKMGLIQEIEEHHEIGGEG